MKILFATSLTNIYTLHCMSTMYNKGVYFRYHGPTKGKIQYFDDYDVGISFLYRYKIPKEGLSKPWINFHPAPLPEYGGRNVAYHAIMNKETVFGGTIHYMDENFDTGPIIEVKKKSILYMDAGEVVDVSYQCLQELFDIYIDDIIAGKTLPSTPQTNTNYYPKTNINDYLEVDNYTKQRILALTCGAYHPKIKIGNKEFHIVQDYE